MAEERPDLRVVCTYFGREKGEVNRWSGDLQTLRVGSLYGGGRKTVSKEEGSQGTRECVGQNQLLNYNTKTNSQTALKVGTVNVSCPGELFMNKVECCI